MRDDMAKMLVETHRSNGRATPYKQVRRAQKQKDPEQLATKEGLKAHYSYNLKEFGENFAPLLGYLRKSAGKKWDNVFSELCASLKGGGTVIDHTRVHLFRDFVETKPRWIDGSPHYCDYGYRDDGTHPITNGYFYVDLEGVLQEAKSPRPKNRRKGPRVHIRRGEDEYLKVAGIWYAIKTQPMPSDTKGAIIRDVICGSIVCHETAYTGYRHSFLRYSWPVRKDVQDIRNAYSDGGKRYAVSKRQLNSRELKRLKLERR